MLPGIWAAPPASVSRVNAGGGAKSGPLGAPGEFHQARGEVVKLGVGAVA